MLRAVAASAITGSRKEAAAALGLREQTVKNSVGDAMAVTGTHSVAQVCIALGWLEVPPAYSPKMDEVNPRK